ncbi:MAG: helix-turn-helix transcriptional regulator, partial [Clostridia bacterium]
IQSVIAALRGIQSAMDNDEVEYLVEKVGALVANQANQQQDPSVNLRYTPTYSEKEALGKLLQAIKLSCLVSFAYVDVNGAETERVVEPVGLFLKGYAWYLYAYCRTRSDFRIFRLSRMERLAITSTSFEKRNFTINDAEEKWESQLAPLTFRTVFIFSASVKSRVMDDFDPMEMETLPDGSIRVTTYYTGMDRALRHVLSYGCDARVMEPIALRTELRKQILKMVGFYT